MIKRADFVRDVEQGRALLKRTERHMAYFAVPFGFAQLAGFRWLEAAYGKENSRGLEGALFLAYMAIFVVLFARYIRAERNLGPACPSCGRRFSKMSASLAIATGRCDRCGEQVIE